MNWISNKSEGLWKKTASTFSDTKEKVKDKVKEGGSDISGKIREWLISLFVKAIESCSTEQDRLDVISWLTLMREVVTDSSLSFQAKAKKIHSLINSKKAVQIVFHSVVKTVENYKNSDLPLPVKIAIPATLGAAAIVGGHGVGIVAFGGGIGMPILVLVFLGAAGITSVLEVFLGQSESKDYISVVMALIARDEILRRAKKSMKDAMTAEAAEPKASVMPIEEKELRKKLEEMDFFDFEKHVMSFFQNNGMMAWVTKKSNDAGVDGFARHPSGLIVVQCKRYTATNPVGRPAIQQFKGVVEENEAWRGYVVTTSYFTEEAKESADKNDRLILIDMNTLVKWHTDGFLIQ